MKTSLSLEASHPEKEHKLYACGECGQRWQASRAWNWSNNEYLFKIPTVDVESWIAEVFVQPDELLIFTATFGDFLNRNRFSVTENSCQMQGCPNMAVSGSVNCLHHHVEALQRVRALPAFPSGRWFSPYERENIVPAL